MVSVEHVNATAIQIVWEVKMVFSKNVFFLLLFPE